mmetsp:Transcript_11387/g.25398  ORF Transcript_11387/g.25398 Transcript_11387/m.25398 type:complete len:242 (-) Transcript_11387:65-790(-)
MARTQLVHRWRLQSLLRLELHLTEDIVTKPPGGRCDVLVNPGNEELVGTSRLPYFPMVSEAGTCHMFYSDQVVDGRVHALGREELLHACQELPEVESGVRCPVGSAVVTPAFNALSAYYSRIVHTVPPMYEAPCPAVAPVSEGGSDAHWEEMMLSCYQEAIAIARSSTSGGCTMAVPLLGAGARRAPPEEAARVAALALQQVASAPVDAGGHAAVNLCVREGFLPLVQAALLASLGDPAEE